MELLTQSEWAKRHGFSRQYANELVRDGKIKLVNGKVNVEEADKFLEAVRNPGMPLRRKDSSKAAISDGSDLSTMLLRTRIKNEMERGKLLEAKAKAELGKLISAEDVKEAAFTKARIIRDALMNLPDRVATLLASITDPHKIHELLTQEIRIVLEELSND